MTTTNQCCEKCKEFRKVKPAIGASIRIPFCKNISCECHMILCTNNNECICNHANPETDCFPKIRCACKVHGNFESKPDDWKKSSAEIAAEIALAAHKHCKNYAVFSEIIYQGIHFLLSRQKQELEEHHATDCANHEKKWRGEYQNIFKWLLGEEGDFPDLSQKPHYSFRTELRKRISQVESLIDNLK